MTPFLVIPVVLAVVVIVVWYRRDLATRRQRFIINYIFPRNVLDKLGQDYPHLTSTEHDTVGRGLKQFFLAHAKKGQFVSMPSVAADAMWHEFILHTRQYQKFCRLAFGKFLHHTPASALGARYANNDGLRRMWWLACVQENIDARRPTRLPLLFALDAQLKIKNGFHYVPRCEMFPKAAGQPAIYCAADLGSTPLDTHSGGEGGGGSGKDSDGSGAGSDSAGGDGGGGGCGGD